MLLPVTLDLAQKSKAVTVISRHAREFPWAPEGVLHHERLDYRDEGMLRDVLDAVVEERGPFDLVVVWVHETAPGAPLVIAEYVGMGGRYVHVLGSDAANPAHLERSLRLKMQKFMQMTYQEVILGFVLVGNGARWLRNGEISEGVLGAIDSRVLRTVVGVVEPWEKRP